MHYMAVMTLKMALNIQINCLNNVRKYNLAYVQEYKKKSLINNSDNKIKNVF